MTLDYRELKKEFLKKQRQEKESWKKNNLEEDECMTKEEALLRDKKQEHWEYLVGKLFK